MNELFYFINSKYNSEYKIDAIAQSDFKNVLLECYTQDWNLIEYPKYITI